MSESDSRGRPDTADEVIRFQALKRAEHFGAAAERSLHERPDDLERARIFASICAAFAKLATDPGGIR